MLLVEGFEGCKVEGVPQQSVGFVEDLFLFLFFPFLMLLLLLFVEIDMIVGL